MGGYGPHPWPLSRWERGTAVLHRWTGCAGFLGGWVGNGIATWFDRLTMSGCAPRSICVECQAFLRVWRRDGSIRVVVPRGFVSSGFRGGPPRSVATAVCAFRPPGPLCQICHVAVADGRNQASSPSRVSPPGTPCTRPGAPRRDRPGWSAGPASGHCPEIRGPILPGRSTPSRRIAPVRAARRSGWRR